MYPSCWSLLHAGNFRHCLTLMGGLDVLDIRLVVLVVRVSCLLKVCEYAEENFGFVD